MRSFFTRFIPAGSIVLALTTFGSYALGLLRDRTFAQTYGLSSSLDAYNAAFLLPDFFFNLLVASGIAAAVVPIFSDRKQASRRAAYTYLNSVLSAATLVMVAVGLCLILFAGPASRLVAPGLAAADQATVARLMRILALSPILFAGSNALGAALIAERRFLFYGLSPILYNLGIIGGTIWLTPRFGIMGTALGTLGGAGAHSLIRAIDLWRVGWRPKPEAQWQTREFKQTIRLMLPKMLGHPVELTTFWLFTAIASTMAVGSISALNFARNFQSVPVSIIGITMSTAVFPLLAEAIARKNYQEFSQTLARIFSSIFGISAVAALTLWLIRAPLVRLLLGGGSFDEAAVARTAMVLGVFCLSIPTESVSHLLARAFYARKNTLIPVMFSIASLLISVGGAWWLMPRFGLLALPAGFFLGSAVKTVGLAGLLHRLRHR